MENVQVEQVLSRYGALILHLAYSYLHNQSDAEDILQDTLIQYLKRTEAFESPEHEKAWLIRVTGNLCKNKLKSAGYSYEELPEDYGTDGIPEESIAIFHAVQALPLKYREVIHLFYYEDATTAQIAKMLGKNEVTVRSLLSRGRKILKKQLEEV